jgi:t-SNARE complex subunit (syntaxin)
LPNLSLHVNNYSSSIKTDISHRIFLDKDDYPQIEKQELKLVNSVVNRINEINDNIVQITNKLDKIHPLTIKQIMIDIITQINFLNKSIDINQFSKFKTFIIPIENNLQNHIDKYEQESLHLFSKKINKRNLKQRFKYSLSSKLRNFRRIFMQRISLSRKNNGTSKYKKFEL